MDLFSLLVEFQRNSFEFQQTPGAGCSQRAGTIKATWLEGATALSETHGAGGCTANLHSAAVSRIAKPHASDTGTRMYPLNRKRHHACC
jgi:hypothetical protein